MRPRHSFLLVTTLTVAGVLATLLLSPLVLQFLVRLYPVDWARLSEAGQSYTGAATGLSILALAGVVYSIVLQSRQGRAQQQHAARSMQFDLLKMSMDDLDLACVASGNSRGFSTARYEAHRLNIYMSLWFRYLQYAYVVGNLTDTSLRESLINDIFAIDAFRERWRYIEPFWRSESVSPIERNFIRIVSESCAAAVPVDGP